METLFLSLTSMVTSFIAGITGLAGGLLLIAMMPFWLAPAAIVPVHGVVQFVSNASRVAFAWRSVYWPVVTSFTLGSLLGLAVFGTMYRSIPVDWIPACIGGYILLTIWHPWFSQFMARFRHIWALGFVQTGLGVVVGTTGPLTTALLAQKLQDKEQLVATNALLMGQSHGFKVILFGIMGFGFSDHVWLITTMVAGALLGTWIGTQVRRRISELHFQLMLKWLLTLLALHMVVSAVIR